MNTRYYNKNQYHFQRREIQLAPTIIVKSQREQSCSKIGRNDLFLCIIMVQNTNELNHLDSRPVCFVSIRTKRFEFG
jgi:hypothetical protein